MALFFPFVPVLLLLTLHSYGTHYQVFLSTHVSQTHQGHIPFHQTIPLACFNLLEGPDERGGYSFRQLLCGHCKTDKVIFNCLPVIVSLLGTFIVFSFFHNPHPSGTPDRFKQTPRVIQTWFDLILLPLLSNVFLPPSLYAMSYTKWVAVTHKQIFRFWLDVEEAVRKK